MNYAARLSRLGDALAEQGVEALLATDLVNVRYLTGYTGSNGAIVARPDGAVFLTDFRYLQRVAPIREFIEVQQATQDLLRHVSTRWATLAPAAGRIGFESEHLSHAGHALLAEASGAVELVATSGVVERLRLVKDSDEIEAIRRSAAMLEPIYVQLAAEGLAGRDRLLARLGVGQRAGLAGGDDRIERDALRAVLAHQLVDAPGHVE
ncbi:MAG: hypothetical protein QOI17_1482, partial [Gaiellales bacterium]|nr:hypothetical protein [Gaiellales bacterium]